MMRLISQRLEIVGALAATIVVVAVMPGSASGALTHLATLSAPENRSVQGLGPVGISSQAAFAEGSQVYAFAKSPNGWGSQAAGGVVMDSAGAVPVPTTLAVAGRTVIVNESLPSAAGFEDVFTEPNGGWSGFVVEAARLRASSGAILYGAAISGSTVVAKGVDPRTGGGVLYVFREPSGGWAGTVSEVAKLTDSHGGMVGSPAISGRFVFATVGDKTDVFSEPAGGWSGTLHEAATLSPPGGPVAVWGRTVLAGLNVFREPTRGWSGVVHPAARLVPKQNTQNVLGFVESMSATTIALGAYSLGPGHQCPCQGAVWVFTKPANGWSGTVASAPALRPVTTDGPVTLALDRQTLLVGGASTAELYAVSAPPTVTPVSHTGLQRRKPKLRFQLQAGVGESPIDGFILRLPQGLSFERNPKQPLTGIAITGGRNYRVTMRHGSLAAKSTRPASRLSVAIAFPLIREDTALARRVARLIKSNRALAPRHKRTITLRLSLRVIDVTDKVTHLTIPIVIK